MNAAELRALGERLKLVDPLFPCDYDRIAQAADVIELIAWAEGEQIEIHKTMNGVHVVLGWGPLEFRGDTLIDTLRRAREAAR